LEATELKEEWLTPTEQVVEVKEQKKGEVMKQQNRYKESG